MATHRIPNADGQIRQLNVGAVNGELAATLNIDLHSVPGKIKLARPFKRVATAAQIGSEIIEAFALQGASAYALTNTALFSSPKPFTVWTSEATTPSNAEDMVVFDSQIVITGNTDLDAFDGNTYLEDWWTDAGGPALTGSNPHILEVARIGEETLIVTDGSVVRGYTGAIAGGGTFTAVDLDSIFTAICAKSSIRSVWIGTFTEDADQAYVFEWDGASTNYTQAYPTGAKAVLAIEIVDDVPVIITERGEIKFFNNAGFTTKAQFPFAMEPVFADGVETGLIQTNNTSRPVHPKGMKRVGNTLLIHMAFRDIDNDLPLDERSPMGVWALDLTTYSLTHLGSADNETNLDASSPIMVINDSDTRIFIGGEKNAPSNSQGIWIEDLDPEAENYGYFVSTEMESDTVKDVYEEIITKALLGEDDKILVKSRVSNDTALPITVEDAAWSTTTKFNSTADLSYIQTRFDAGKRDEIEVIRGSGAGRLAHIVAIQKSSTVYQITVDEAIGTPNELADIRFDNWKKALKDMTAANCDTPELKRLGLGDSGTWAQTKVELRGKAGLPEVRGTIVKTNTKEEL